MFMEINISGFHKVSKLLIRFLNLCVLKHMKLHLQYLFKFYLYPWKFTPMSENDYVVTVVINGNLTVILTVL